MKKSLYSLLILSAFIAVPAMASVTVDETTDAEYMINGGYSQATAEDVLVAKNRAASKPIEPLYNKNQNAFVKGLKRIYAYIDPAVDNEPQRIHHDIHRSPSFSDL